jgi:DNA-binding CsgD family transcriptional regulator
MEKALTPDLKLHMTLVGKGLTNREAEVAALVTKGLSNFEIGRMLFITEKTVKFHLQNIYTKLGLKSRAQLIVHCLPHLGYGSAQVEFVDYCMSFYGPGQIYSEYFKTPVTRDRVQAAMVELLQVEAREFAGDSVDREAVRDIMLRSEAAEAPTKDAREQREKLAIAQADAQPSPVSMYVMGMCSDAQECIRLGNTALANEILNDIKAIIDERLAAKDEHGRHTYSEAERARRQEARRG